MQPEDIPLEIVFEDNAIIVVNKPAGMLVHPTHRDKNGTLLNALAFHLNRDSFPQSREYAEKNVIRPGLVHRLDKETSGLMIVAKSVEMHRRLAREFMKKRVEKRYVALVDGTVRDDEGHDRIADRTLSREKDLGRQSRREIVGYALSGGRATRRHDTCRS